MPELDSDWLSTLAVAADILQHRDQMVEIMPVDRADIIEAELLEERSAHRHAARELVGLLCRLVQRVRQLAREEPRDLAQFDERARRNELREIGRKPPHRGRERHVVVVEEDRKSVVSGKRVSVSLDLGGRGTIKKK